MWDYTNMTFAPREGAYHAPPGESCHPPPLDRAAIVRQKQSMDAATALSWDAATVTVVCPFCLKTHVHGLDHFVRIENRIVQDSRGRYAFVDPSSRCVINRAKCNEQRSYAILFPFDDSDDRVKNLSWELEWAGTGSQGDKTYAPKRFCTVGLRSPHSKSPPRDPAIPWDALPEAHFVKSTTEKKITLVAADNIRVPIYIDHQSSTAAILDRGPAFPPVLATSGFMNCNTNPLMEPCDGLEDLNNGPYWMDQAATLAKELGLVFEPHLNDMKIKRLPGSYHASYAETKLMTYFVRRNYRFRPSDGAGEDVDDDFLQLFLFQPRARRPVIYTSHPNCDLWFREELKARLGIEFDFRVLETRCG